MHVHGTHTTRMHAAYYPQASHCRGDISLNMLEKMQKSFPGYLHCLHTLVRSFTLTSPLKQLLSFSDNLRMIDFIEFRES